MSTDNHEDDQRGGFKIYLPENMITLNLDLLRNEPNIPAAIRLMATNFGKDYFSLGKFLKNFSDTDLAWIMDTSVAFAESVYKLRTSRRTTKEAYNLAGDDSFFVMVCHLLALGEGLPISLKAKDVSKLAGAVTAVVKFEQISRKDPNLKINYRALTLDPYLGLPEGISEVDPYKGRDFWVLRYESEEEPLLQKAFSKANDAYLRGEIPDLLDIMEDMIAEREASSKDRGEKSKKVTKSVDTPRLMPEKPEAFKSLDINPTSDSKQESEPKLEPRPKPRRNLDW